MIKDDSELVHWVRAEALDSVSILAIVLCGSRARGTSDQVSDLDLLVVIEGSRKYLKWGTWQGIPTEMMYVPYTRLSEVRPGLLSKRRILWQQETFDTRQIPHTSARSSNGGIPLGYTAWDLRQSLRVLEMLLRDGKTAAFWYGVGAWMTLAVRYVLESKGQAIPTHRRQWPLLQETSPEIAAVFEDVYKTSDPQEVYSMMAGILDHHLHVAPWQPIQDAPMVRLDSIVAGIEEFSIRKLAASEAHHIERYWQSHWGSTVVVSRGLQHVASHVIGWIAEDRLGTVVGLVTVDPKTAWEVVSLDSDRSGHGIGTALLKRVEEDAWQAGMKRLWLITSNDNVAALRFYQKRRWDLVAVHRGAIDHARTLKPEIPLTSQDDIPIRHEVELEKILD